MGVTLIITSTGLFVLGGFGSLWAATRATYLNWAYAEGYTPSAFTSARQVYKRMARWRWAWNMFNWATAFGWVGTLSTQWHYLLHGDIGGGVLMGVVYLGLIIAWVYQMRSANKAFLERKPWRLNGGEEEPI